MELEGVSFSNEVDPPLLNKVSFKAHVGEIVAIVGRSGAGESTIINLLLGMHQPSTGEYIK